MCCARGVFGEPLGTAVHESTLMSCLERTAGASCSPKRFGRVRGSRSRLRRARDRS